MPDIDSLFVAIFNLSGMKLQSALLERAETLVTNLFYVLKNRTTMGADNVSYREHLDALQKSLGALLEGHGAVDLCARHQSLYINGCLIPQLGVGRDEPQGYLVDAFERHQLEEIRFERAPETDELLTVLDIVDTLPAGWPDEGRISGPGIEITRALPGEEPAPPGDPSERASWVWLNLLDARSALDRGAEASLRDALRFIRWHLGELALLCESHQSLMLSLTHLRWRDRFKGRPEVLDVNTAILACLMGQLLALPRSEVQKLAAGGLLHRWVPVDETGATNPAVRSAAMLLKAGGVNPFNFALMVLLNERFQPARSRSAEIVRVAASFEDLLASSECTVATALSTLLSDSEVYYGKTTRLLLDVWAAHGPSGAPNHRLDSAH